MGNFLLKPRRGNGARHIERLHDSSKTRCGRSADAYFPQPIPDEFVPNTCQRCLKSWREDSEVRAILERHSADVRRAERTDLGKGLLVLAGFGLTVVIVVAALLDILNDSDEGDAPSNKYSDTKCAALRFEATGDGSGAEDAAVEYGIHCE